MKPPFSFSKAAFTLIEVMVATVIVVILAGIMISAVDMSAKSFSRTSAKIEQFSEARRGFEVVTRRLAEATLNTYFDYYDKDGEARPTLETRRSEVNYTKFMNFTPATYGRQSELRFVCGPMNTTETDTDIAPGGTEDRPTHGVFFQAPVGEVEDRDTIGMLDQTLNSWGYFLEIGEDTAYIPKVLRQLNKPRRRSRLLEFRQPTELNPIYFPAYAGAASKQKAKTRNFWFIDGINKPTDRPVRVVSENVIAMILVPRLARPDELARIKDKDLKLASADDDKAALSPQYFYDSALNSTRVAPMAPLTATEKPEDVNPKNQLPPVVQVVMIALDEASADKLDRDTPGQRGFGLKFEEDLKRSVRLEDNASTPEPDDGELNTIEAKLTNRHLNYRVFNTTVIIRGAKWSRAQTN
jgi:uncharacterized protein (TIGR02599 family)